MSERKFNYPCILDPMKDCPIECKLHMFSVKSLLNVANNHSNTPEEELAILRSDAKDERNSFRVINRNILQVSGVLEDCEHYPDADIAQELT